MAKATIKSRTMFQVFTGQVNDAYDQLLKDLDAEIVRMDALGVSEPEIFARLEQELKDRTGAFGSFKGWVEGETDKLVHAGGQIESNELMREAGDKFTWQLDPTAKEHCGDCLRNSGEDPKTWVEWEAIGIPGAGNTICDGYCKCTLTVA